MAIEPTDAWALRINGTIVSTHAAREVAEMQAETVRGEHPGYDVETVPVAITARQTTPAHTVYCWRSDNKRQPFWWHVKAKNGNVVSSGQGYSRRIDMLRMIANLHPTLPVVWLNEGEAGKGGEK